MPTIARIAMGLVTGATGGAIFYLLALPLPWMPGALIATMTAAVGRWPVLAPGGLTKWG